MLVKTQEPGPGSTWTVPFGTRHQLALSSPSILSSHFCPNVGPPSHFFHTQALISFPTLPPFWYAHLYLWPRTTPISSASFLKILFHLLAHETRSCHGPLTVFTILSFSLYGLSRHSVMSHDLQILRLLTHPVSFYFTCHYHLEQFKFPALQS